MLPSKLFCPALLAVYSRVLTYCPSCPQFQVVLRSCSALQDSPQVNVGNTVITGTVFPGQPSNIEFFGGIPFAKPPTGDLRLKPAVFLPTPEVPTLDGTGHGHICLQHYATNFTMSEDCLSLNVYRPAGTSPDAKLPVMFWIYGGGYVVGDSPTFNGSTIVTYSVERETPVIFITFHYRLGPLGFPQGIEAGQRKTLNLGLGDQIAALQWVHRNIANFGGDSSKITVFGQSAGAASSVIHLYGTEIGKYARAIILQSFSTLPTFEPGRNEAAWQTFVAAVPPCAHVANTTNTFDCLRTEADSDSLLEGLVKAEITAGQTAFKPNIDGPGGFLPDRPSKMAYKTHLPALVGSTLDEGTMFTPQDIDSEDRIRELLTTFTSPQLDPEKFAAGVEKILQLYPDVPALGAPFRTGDETFGLSSQYKRYAALYGDFIFESPRRSFLREMSEAGSKVYGYLFVDAGGYGAPPAPPPGALGIMHGAEISYVFYNFIFGPVTPVTLNLSRIVQDYWISFATNLDPNDDRGFKRPYWDQHTSRHQNIIEFDSNKSFMCPDDYRLPQIAFWQDNPDLFHQ